MVRVVAEVTATLYSDRCNKKKAKLSVCWNLSFNGISGEKAFRLLAISIQFFTIFLHFPIYLGQSPPIT